MATSFGEGFAIGMVSGDLHRAQRENQALRNELYEERAKVVELNEEVARLKTKTSADLNKLFDLATQNTVAYAFFDGVLKGLAHLPQNEKKKFMQEVADYSQSRFGVLYERTATFAQQNNLKFNGYMDYLAKFDTKKDFMSLMEK